MNSVIRYFGGKGNMFNNIITEFPEKGSYVMYVEPFAGSYSIGLHTPEDRIAPIEIFNDLDDNVYSLYKVIRDKELYPKFKEMCDLSVYSEAQRKEYKEKLKDGELSLLDRAFMFFYVNRTSHNGIGGFSVNTIIRRNMSKSVSDMLSCIDRMDVFHQRVSRLIVMKRDALELIEQYDRDNVFFYCDPPYIHDTRGETRYAVEMENEGHEKFIDLCLKSSAKFLISGYDHPIYDRLVENGWKKIQFDVNTVDGTRKAKTKIETLWKNY